jgi:galactokinase
MYGVISARSTRAQNQSDEANQLGRRLLALGHPMVLSDDARRYFLVLTEEMRALMAYSALSASQRMTTIAEFGSMPSAKDVEAYLIESGTITFCKAQGLPLSDWRDALKQ